MGENISYNSLHEKYDKLIKGKGSPVGIKLLKKKEDIKNLRVMSLEENRALCQVLKLSAVYEKTRGIHFENVDACVIGTYIMGFGLPPEDIKDRWIRGFNYTSKRFDDLVKNIEVLPQKKYNGAIIAPLKDFDRLDLDPEAVVMFVNSAQSYLFMGSYFDSTGEKPCSYINGHAACEIISAVSLGKSPWLTIPCGGARSIADSQDDEIWVGMRPEDLNICLSRLEEIGFKYPAPVNQIVMDPLNSKHPLTYLISREPKK